MYDALKFDLGQQVEMLWHKDTDLKGFTTEDCIVLPGGFSYGDYLRTGAIARFSPIMESVIAFAKKGGNVFGVCNGFQILCESHLLPGALLRNAGQQFLSKNVYLRGEGDGGQALKIPIAHGEGRYYADEKTLDELEGNGQIVYRYADAAGVIGAPGANPNGSVRNIAGICNATRNVLGMKPHPERATNEALGNTDGIAIINTLFIERAGASVKGKAALVNI
jgi:phosphoribosylformylglycinamidine synthase